MCFTAQLVFFSVSRSAFILAHFSCIPLVYENKTKSRTLYWSEFIELLSPSILCTSSVSMAHLQICLKLSIISRWCTSLFHKGNPFKGRLLIRVLQPPYIGSKSLTFYCYITSVKSSVSKMCYKLSIGPVSPKASFTCSCVDWSPSFYLQGFSCEALF